MTLSTQQKGIERFRLGKTLGFWLQQDLFVRPSNLLVFKIIGLHFLQIFKLFLNGLSCCNSTWVRGKDRVIKKTTCLGRVKRDVILRANVRKIGSQTFIPTVTNNCTSPMGTTENNLMGHQSQFVVTKKRRNFYGFPKTRNKCTTVAP